MIDSDPTQITPTKFTFCDRDRFQETAFCLEHQPARMYAGIGEALERVPMTRAPDHILPAPGIKDSPWLKKSADAVTVVGYFEGRWHSQRPAFGCALAWQPQLRGGAIEHVFFRRRWMNAFQNAVHLNPRRALTRNGAVQTLDEIALVRLWGMSGESGSFPSRVLLDCFKAIENNIRTRSATESVRLHQMVHPASEERHRCH